MSRKRTWIMRVALIVLAPILAVLALELTLSLTGWGYPTGFLIKDDAYGGRFWTENPFFGYRFFPRQQARVPCFIHSPVQVPSNSLRVVVLGESAAMGDPEPQFGMPRLLERMLADMQPERNVEVLNAAMTAINSHVIREIVPSVLKWKPDIAVLYIGNNEVVGPFGPGSPFFNNPSLGSVRRWSILLGRLRITQLLLGLRNMVNPQREEGFEWGGMDMFLSYSVALSDPRLALVYDNFRKNLLGMIKDLKQQGTKIVLCTVAVNIRDCAPFSAGSDGEANVSFLKGKEAFEDGDYETARKFLLQATDLDLLRFRADSYINGIIRNIATNDENIVFVDIESMAGEISDGVPGNNLFLDHVHYTPEGNAWLAGNIAAAIYPRKKDKLSANEDYLLSLPYTEAQGVSVLQEMMARKNRPPFTQQLNHREDMRALQEQLDYNYLTRSQKRLALSNALFQASIYSGDPYNRFELSRIHRNWGQYDLALEVLRRVIRNYPHHLTFTGTYILMEAAYGDPNIAVQYIWTEAEKRPFSLSYLNLAVQKIAQRKTPKAAMKFMDMSEGRLPWLKEQQLWLNLRHQNEALNKCISKADVCIVSQRWSEALEGLDRAADINKNVREVYVLAARCYEALGKHSLSDASWERADDLNK